MKGTKMRLSPTSDLEEVMQEPTQEEEYDFSDLLGETSVTKAKPKKKKVVEPEQGLDTLLRNKTVSKGTVKKEKVAQFRISEEGFEFLVSESRTRGFHSVAEMLRQALKERLSDPDFVWKG